MSIKEAKLCYPSDNGADIVSEASLIEIISFTQTEVRVYMSDSSSSIFKSAKTIRCIIGGIDGLGFYERTCRKELLLPAS